MQKQIPYTPHFLSKKQPPETATWLWHGSCGKVMFSVMSVCQVVILSTVGVPMWPVPSPSLTPVVMGPHWFCPVGKRLVRILPEWFLVRSWWWQQRHTCWVQVLEKISLEVIFFVAGKISLALRTLHSQQRDYLDEVQPDVTSFFC